MTRNYVALFFSIIIVLTALLEGFLGIHGVVVNIQLANIVERKQQLLDVQELELYNLEQRLEHVWDEDELLDRAKMMGYIQAGETPYYFLEEEDNTTNVDGAVTNRDNDNDRTVKIGTTTFEGIPLWLNLVFAFIGSCVCAGICKIVGKSRKNHSFTVPSGERLHGNYR